MRRGYKGRNVVRLELRPSTGADPHSRQFCMPGGVVDSANGQALCVNLRLSRPLSWHVVHNVPCDASMCTCALHQSGPPATHPPPRLWFEPGLAVVVPGGL